ncbi:trans-sialidase [Trypanosoma cruzi Dm28c]|uniref:Trans-sialidase n=1 Tax=Trypanosoma cruzi Dm28c TaxID=1416333 RepID=V5B3R6_TRYCR|nr:trans-sialidase [Trypanosoma cruzi Dm28c]
MIVDCEDGQRVYESRDKGTTWTEAIGTLPGVWTKTRLYFWYLSLRVEALITATTEGRKVMMYVQRGNFSGDNKPNPLYICVTDNNRSFCFGLVVVEEAAVNWEFASNLLYSDGSLHLLQRRGNGEGSAISLAPLTEELKEIESVLRTWAKLDAFFSASSTPTAGLVGFLSNTSSGGNTWIDEYLCLNATVTNAVKVKDGFQLMEIDSGVLWSLNTRVNNVRHVSLSHYFTLVASVTIEGTLSENTSLLTASVEKNNSNHTMGILYTADLKWVTELKNKITKSSTWEPNKEHQVELTLHGKKVFFCIDGKLLVEEEVPLTGETPL